MQCLLNANDIIHKIRINILQFLWKQRKLRIAKAIMMKQNGTLESKLPHFKLYYSAKVIKTGWSWHKNRNINQWYRIESPVVSPCSYGQLIYNKGVKNIQWRKRRKTSLYNKWCWESWTGSCTRMKLEHWQTPYTKIN